LPVFTPEAGVFSSDYLTLRLTPRRQRSV
jgi:hypothetical protein